MEIRPATFVDIPAMIKIANASAPAAQWDQLHYMHLVSHPDAIVLIASEEHPCGFVAGNIVGGDCELENIVVSGESQRQGIASALLERFIVDARRKNATRFLLEVRESNDAARKLYLKFGFHLAGRRKGYYTGPEEDALLLQLDLHRA